MFAEGEDTSQTISAYANALSQQERGLISHSDSKYAYEVGEVTPVVQEERKIREFQPPSSTKRTDIKFDYVPQ